MAFFSKSSHSISLPAKVATARLGVETTNRVLRNTYMLLAISMVPTVIGAFLGAIYPLIAIIGKWPFLISFIGAMMGLRYFIIKNRNNASGVGWMLLFTFVMGYFIGPLIGLALGSFSNGAALVATAAGGTAAIFFGVAGYATVTKRDFSSMGLGKILGIGAGMLFTISVLNFFFASSLIVIAISSLYIVIAPGLILFTVNRVVRGGEDNYIMASLTIYIMLLNIFQSLLNLLMFFAGDRD